MSDYSEKVSQLQARVLAGETLTRDELRSVIQMLREQRLSSEGAVAGGSKVKAVKAAKPAKVTETAADLLSQLEGL